jgi:Aerotolerance regulator N-terminal
MTFLNPLVLFGLIAAGIPVLIHLLQLKKFRQVEFSSIRFLKEIQHASARRVKLRDYLLLILRTLAIAALVLAFSRPVLKGFLGANSKTASVVIVDDSPSTTARNEYGEISSQIRSVASGLLNSFHAGDDVGLIFTSNAVDSAEGVSTSEPRALWTRVTRSEPSAVTGSYTSAIRDALRKLTASGYVNKQIYVIGDMQRSEFQKPAAMEPPPNTRIFFLATEESPNDNLSVSNVKFLNPVVEVNSPSQIEATVTNNDGSDKRGVIVSLFLDRRKVAQSAVDIAAGTSRAVRLAFSVASGGFHQGAVQIDDNSIQSDNRYSFSFYAIRRLNVLFVSSTTGDDYVLSAARAVMDTSTVIDTRSVTPAQFVYSNLRGIDVVVAESYPSGGGSSESSRGFDTKMIDFADAGGGAILFAPAPDQVNSFAGLVGGMKVGTVTRLLSGSRAGFQSLDRIDAADDFFAGIFSSGQSADQIKNQLVTKIYGGVVIEPNPFAHVLMSMSAGPFLISREVGSGFTFVVATGADTASSNFPLSPFFPVVIQRALFYSAAVRYRPVQVFAGQRVEYRYPEGGIKTATLFSPSGNRTDLLPEYVGAAARFTIGNLDRLGTYTLAAGDTLCEISVNVDPRESDLTQASASRMESFARELGFATGNVFVVKADKNAVASIDRIRRGEDLSSIFAAAALLFLIAEIFVARMKTI